MKTIHVSQGHENSIGLEVFIKSFLLLTTEQQKKFILHVFKDDLLNTIKSLKLSASFSESSVDLGHSNLGLNLLSDSDSKISKSFQSLVSAESFLNKDDILLTLPTEKKSLNDGKTQFLGHTDYFRKKYSNENVVMLFVSDNSNLALLTEHIPLSEIEKTLTPEFVVEKISQLIEGPYSFERFIFAGVNPHCGESGIIGSADNSLREAIDTLKNKYKNLRFEGPFSGDTLFLDTNSSTKADCFVSPFHDQGLAPFKAISGLRASNISVGLPFVRLSPDHGTAFDLYGKDKANYFGTLFTVSEALNILESNGN